MGIESPSPESLKETKKFQNLRADPVTSISVLQEKGLWVTGGFIIGFDSDTEDIFNRQRDFVECAAIPWAMMGFLQAPRTTPLYRRMQNENRLLADDYATNFHPPNFQTVIPRAFLMRRFREILLALYEPSKYFERALRSLEVWKARGQKGPALPLLPTAKLVLALLWRDGIRWEHRRHCWAYLLRTRQWRKDPLKRWWAIALLATARHFITHAHEVAREIEGELTALKADADIGWKPSPERT